VVVKDELLAAYPDLGRAVFDAFAESKRRYLDAGPDDLHRQVLALTGADPLPYGIEPNRRTLETLIDHAMSQHILDRRPPVEDLFALEG
jgi:4,5-dihydroxyphthalate decarboxylase